MDTLLRYRPFLIAAVCLFLFVSNGFAQKGNIENLKIGYITKEVDLTESEAQAFWPVYNKYEKLFKNTNIKLREIKQKERSKLSEGEKAKLNEERITLEGDKAALKRKRHNELKSVLPASKISKLYTTEDDFKRMLIKDYQNKRRKGF